MATAYFTATFTYHTFYYTGKEIHISSIYFSYLLDTCSVHKNHRTHRTFPMARPKCLMRDFTNSNKIYKAHRANIWWIMKVLGVHCTWWVFLLQNIFYSKDYTQERKYAIPYTKHSNIIKLSWQKHYHQSTHDFNVISYLLYFIGSHYILNAENTYIAGSWQWPKQSNRKKQWNKTMEQVDILYICYYKCLNKTILLSSLFWLTQTVINFMSRVCSLCMVYTKYFKLTGHRVFI